MDAGFELEFDDDDVVGIELVESPSFCRLFGADFAVDPIADRGRTAGVTVPVRELLRFPWPGT